MNKARYCRFICFARRFPLSCTLEDVGCHRSGMVHKQQQYSTDEALKLGRLVYWFCIVWFGRFSG
jgi:hypothetical protein